MDSRDRPLTHAERGRLGARSRWGDAPRVYKLGDLTPEQRRLVDALVTAARKEAAPVDVTSGAADAEVRRGSVERSAT